MCWRLFQQAIRSPRSLGNKALVGRAAQAGVRLLGGDPVVTVAQGGGQDSAIARGGKEVPKASAPALVKARAGNVPLGGPVGEVDLAVVAVAEDSAVGRRPRNSPTPQCVWIERPERRCGRSLDARKSRRNRCSPPIATARRPQ